MFRAKKNNTPTASAPTTARDGAEFNFKEHWDSSPFMTLAYLISSTESPVATLALTINILHEQNVISAAQLYQLGIQYDELQELRESIADAESVAELSKGLQIMTAIREFDRQVDHILQEQNAHIDLEARAVFRTALVTFASENEILDLHSAFRLLLAEQPDKVKMLLTSNRTEQYGERNI